MLFLGTGGVVGPHYASSKSALHGILHWIAQRYAKEGIVCLVSLPRIPTPHCALDMQHSCPRAHRQYVRPAHRLVPRALRLTTDTGMIPENREDFAVRVPPRPLPPLYRRTRLPGAHSRRTAWRAGGDRGDRGDARQSAVHDEQGRLRSRPIASGLTVPRRAGHHRGWRVDDGCIDALRKWTGK
jgi:hypothetical protein